MSSIQNLPRVIQQAISKDWFDGTFTIKAHRLRERWLDDLGMTIELECVDCGISYEVDTVQSNDAIRAFIGSRFEWCAKQPSHECGALKVRKAGLYCDACVAPAEEVRL